MANWSLCGRHVSPDKPPTPVFINLDNVLTVERQWDLTTVVMRWAANGPTLTLCRRRLLALSLLPALCKLRGL
jgi:hypothetical protein